MIARFLTLGSGNETSNGLFESFNIFILGIIFGVNNVHRVLEHDKAFSVGVKLIDLIDYRPYLADVSIARCPMRVCKLLRLLYI